MSNRPTLLIACCFLVLTLNSCQGPLDKTFELPYYQHHYNEMLKSDEITPSDLFLINYAIVRQRDYYNYQLEGKSYREILELAKEFNANGLPVEEQYHRNGEQEFLRLKSFAEGMGMVRKDESSSRLKKVLFFSSSFENITGQDVVLESASFLVKGPFKDHLSTVGYEVNCVIKAGQKIQIRFFVDASNIVKNLLYDRPFKAPYTGINDLLNAIEVEVGGASVSTLTFGYEDCNFYARIPPHTAMDYQKAFENKEWQIRDADGQVTSLNLGNTHFTVEYSDDPININEFLK